MENLPGIPPADTTKKMHDCDVCGARVQELRRGRCWGCYARWVDTRPVGYGARCLGCSERRRRLLRSIELWGGWQPMCFSCSGQALALQPMPPNVEELKLALSRERRGRDRRLGKPDTRVFRYERRVGDRRSTRDDIALIDDDMILEISVDNSDLEVELEDMTRIFTEVAASST